MPIWLGVMVTLEGHHLDSLMQCRETRPCLSILLVIRFSVEVHDPQRITFLLVYRNAKIIRHNYRIASTYSRRKRVVIGDEIFPIGLRFILQSTENNHMKRVRKEQLSYSSLLLVVNRPLP